MLEYDRMDISGGIDINKTNASKECKICDYWYFNPNKAGLFEGIFSRAPRVWPPLHISRRTYLISI